MEYISKNEMAQLKGNSLVVKAIYGPKRTTFNQATKKSEEYVMQGDDWKQVVWEDGKRSLKDCKIDYKNTKKVYDLVLESPVALSVNVKKWNSDKKENEQLDVLDTEFTIKNVSSPVIRDLFEATIAFGKVPVDKDEKPVYDWEEKFLPECKGISFQLTPRKAEFNGKSYFEYTFREDKSSNKTTADESDLPF